jgi:hypothetical protein
MYVTNIPLTFVLNILVKMIKFSERILPKGQVVFFERNKYILVKKSMNAL